MNSATDPQNQWKTGTPMFDAELGPLLSAAEPSDAEFEAWL